MTTETAPPDLGRLGQHTRLHSSLDYQTPADVEAAYYRDNQPAKQPLARQLAL